MHTQISYADLDLVAGEVLPERAVMSTVVTPLVGGGAGGSDASAFAMSGDGDGTTALSACQGQLVHGTPGLLGALGLGSNNPSSSLTCIPAAISGH